MGWEHMKPLTEAEERPGIQTLKGVGGWGWSRAQGGGMTQRDFWGHFAVNAPCSVDPGVRSRERAVVAWLGSCVPPLRGGEGGGPDPYLTQVVASREEESSG